MAVNVIILAAGKGTRMKSSLLKVAHHVVGKPIVCHVIEAVSELPVEKIHVVVGHQSDSLKEQVRYPYVSFVEQKEQLGTGHAVMQVVPFLQDALASDVLIISGDSPLITTETLWKLHDAHHDSKAAVTLLSTVMETPYPYGRILRNGTGAILGVKEEKDCSDEERLIGEVNVGVYLFNRQVLCDHITSLTTENKQKEYYLTDMIHILKENGDTLSSYCMSDEHEAIGINTRMDLAEVNRFLYQRKNLELMKEGVTIIDPSSTFIEPTVIVGKDTIIEPFTVIKGSSVIPEACHIGPHVVMQDAHLVDKARVAPFSNLGPDNT